MPQCVVRVDLPWNPAGVELRPVVLRGRQMRQGGGKAAAAGAAAGSGAAAPLRCVAVDVAFPAGPPAPAPVPNGAAAGAGPGAGPTAAPATEGAGAAGGAAAAPAPAVAGVARGVRGWRLLDCAPPGTRFTLTASADGVPLVRVSAAGCVAGTLQSWA